MTASDAKAAKIAAAPRRGLSRVEAATYIGISSTKFDEMVTDGRMPKPKRIDARRVWDVRALDAAFEALPGGEDDVNRWDDVSAELPSQQKYPAERKHRGRRLGRPIDVPDDPETLAIIDSLVEAGVTRRYAPGEWENEVRGQAMGKLELNAMREFYRTREAPLHYVKGAGLATCARLMARGYIAIAEERGDRSPFYRITPEGEAAWLSIDTGDPASEGKD